MEERTRERAIEYLEHYKNVKHGMMPEWVWNMAIKALEQEPRWIPVSDYLPVTNDEVLVTYIVNDNHKKRYVETANCFDGEWSSVNDEYRIPNTKIEIIAWCEMPKPYKAEVEPHESEET